MPSPFPGMDPWLVDSEVFPDLHDTLVALLREALNAAMPPGYVATTRNRVWVDDESRSEPDVRLFGRPRSHSAADEGDVATMSGLALLGNRAELEPIEEAYLDIVSSKGRRLVTAVEILSRANKTAGKEHRDMYLEKQKEMRLGGVHLVEIDLLREGAHTTAAPRERLCRLRPAFDYHVCVTVEGRIPRIYAAPFRLADRLPAFGIPLEPGVPPVVVDLQPLLDRAYDTGRYSQLVDYTKPCEPPLTAEQQAWTDGILRARA